MRTPKLYILRDHHSIYAYLKKVSVIAYLAHSHKYNNMYTYTQSQFRQILASRKCKILLTTSFLIMYSESITIYKTETSSTLIFVIIFNNIVQMTNTNKISLK